VSGPTSSSEGRVLAFIALGSNIEPGTNLARAVELLAQRLALRGVSRVYQSEAVGAPAAPPFLNAAALVETDLPPARLKREVLRGIEAELGRVRTADRNAPRTIDLDLVLYGDLVLDDPEAALVLPDPEIATRAYLALPLADLAPATRHPTRDEPLAAIAARLGGTPGIRVTEALTRRLRRAVRAPSS
jgi:2-amino-4-hydroxy-6-hydroxymethyldihydropteridine diphosphokinase